MAKSPFTDFHIIPGKYRREQYASHPRRRFGFTTRDGPRGLSATLATDFKREAAGNFGQYFASGSTFGCPSYLPHWHDAVHWTFCCRSWLIASLYVYVCC